MQTTLDNIGISDSDSELLKLLKEASALMDAGNIRDARRRVEEARLLVSSRFSGWKIRTGDNTWIGKKGLYDSDPITYKTVSILKSSLGFRIYSSTYGNVNKLDSSWKNFFIVNSDGEEFPLFKWMMENSSSSVINDACRVLMQERAAVCPLCDNRSNICRLQRASDLFGGEFMSSDDIEDNEMLP